MFGSDGYDMKDKELKKLSRSDLLEILVEQSREIDEMESETQKLRERLEQRELDIKTAGSIAEASIRVSGVFDAAQKAAQQYLGSRRLTWNSVSFDVYEIMTDLIEDCM